VTERGLHHRVWQQVTWFTNASGSVSARTSSYTEIATGMAHYSGGQLVDSSGEIFVTRTGAQATNAMHQLTLLGNINSPGAGAIDLTLPDGQHLKSQPLGIAYFDYSSQKSVWVGEITDSYGQLMPSKTQ